jgi:glycosyltransferase involved in cell wall biosynthesis
LEPHILKILQTLPRRMHFTKRVSHSVELCVSEWVAGSRYRDTTMVVAEQSDEAPLIDIAILRLPPAKRLASWHLALTLRRHIKKAGTDVIVTQQHIATAGRIALFNPRTPVVLQTHNFIDAPVTGRSAARCNRLQAKALNRLAGITLISDATRARFEREWPQVRTPRTVVTNGFDFSTWQRDQPKEKTIIVCGRASEEKGILECAQALREVLPGANGWRAIFILSLTDWFPDYMAKVREMLTPLGDCAEIREGIPYAEVKAAMETAGIAIVASKWEEPFGRTALEAHGPAVALLSSGTGGLRQISGDHALYLDAVTPDAIARGLRTLIEDDDLRARLGEGGADHVRRLFSLTAPAGGASVSGRLDDFLASVVAGTAPKHGKAST